MSPGAIRLYGRSPSSSSARPFPPQCGKRRKSTAYGCCRRFEPLCLAVAECWHAITRRAVMERAMGGRGEEG